jgi:hypothetical protein
MRLDILNLSLMLCAAGAVLAGGTILARREVQERVPVDRTFILTISGSWPKRHPRKIKPR